MPFYSDTQTETSYSCKKRKTDLIVQKDELFVDWSNMLTFGKYKGKYLKDIPEYWLKSALPFVEDKKWNKEIIKIKEELKRRNIKKH